MILGAAGRKSIRSEVRITERSSAVLFVATSSMVNLGFSIINWKLRLERSSRSTNKTSRPYSAAAIAIHIAVVDLPVPPVELAIDNILIYFALASFNCGGERKASGNKNKEERNAFSAISVANSWPGKVGAP